MLNMRDMLTPDVLAGLERYIQAQEERDAIPKAVNDILRDWLMGHGYVAIEDLPDDAE